MAITSPEITGKSRGFYTITKHKKIQPEICVRLTERIIFKEVETIEFSTVYSTDLRKTKMNAEEEDDDDDDNNVEKEEDGTKKKQ